MPANSTAVSAFSPGLSLPNNCSKPVSSLPFHLDVVGFAEEEGVRFSAPYLGSAAIAGHFDESDPGSAATPTA